MERKFEILVVDDDADLASNLQDILEGENYSTAVAHDGQTALTLYREKVFDLAIVDVKLPDIWGTELIQKLSQLLLGVEYIIITGYASLDTAVEAVGRRDIVAYITKPLNVDHLLALIRQVVERKQAEEALQESEERYRNLFEGTYDMIQSVTPDGHFVFVNRAWLETLGYTEAELPGLNLFKIIHPESLPHCQEMFSKVTAGESVRNVQATFVAKDGRSVLVEGNATGRYIGGKVVATQGFFRDITERKRAEEEIKQAAEEWRITFDSIADLVSIHDKDFRLVRVNKAFADAFKMKPQEVIGKTCYEIVHGTKEPWPDCPHKVTLETKKPHVEEFFEPHLGVYLQMSTSPIFNEKGEVVGSVHIAKDVTERKQMEEQLIVTDRLASVGELASGIAHELNNPLTGVIGFSQLLMDKDVSDDVKEDLKTIYSEAQRAAQVVKGLLTFARRHAPVKQLVAINSILEKVLELRAYEQRVSNIQVKTRFAPDLPEVMADYFQLQQVFLNIIINAEHFMIEAHNRGILTITTEKVGDIIKASFADDGPGISKENLGHVFDPFFTTKEVGKGTGLGLSICHGIITEHGGRIYIESELGKGATFVVELPITDH